MNDSYLRIFRSHSVSCSLSTLFRLICHILLATQLENHGLSCHARCTVAKSLRFSVHRPIRGPWMAGSRQMPGESSRPIRHLPVSPSLCEVMTSRFCSWSFWFHWCCLFVGSNFLLFTSIRSCCWLRYQWYMFISAPNWKNRMVFLPFAHRFYFSIPLTTKISRILLFCHAILTWQALSMGKMVLVSSLYMMISTKSCLISIAMFV